jgi:uncharacterized protein YndB with AHSA1/START domain
MSAQDDLTARTTVSIDAGVDDVWQELADPALIREYLLGANVESELRDGRLVVRQGPAGENKGEVLRMEPGRLLEYTHFSPVSGLPDEPQNYHTVTIELTPDGPATTQISLTQDNNGTAEDRKDAADNWHAVFTGLKHYAEGRRKEAA